MNFKRMQRRFYSQSGKDKGFTLIELLIVIVIIGILAGVLISLINPATQQNRARDAGIKAALNKVALSTEGYISAYGSAPDGVQFIGSLQNAIAAPIGGNCTTSLTYNCAFSVEGNVLPELTCGSAWQGSGGNQCYFYYVGGDTPTTKTEFKIFAKSYGITDKVFMYDNKSAVIRHCDLNGGEDGTTCVDP